MGVNIQCKDLVIGADLDAVEFAYSNKYFLIKNRQPYHHSYESCEKDWAEKIYQLYNMGLSPFTDMVVGLRVLADEKLVNIFTNRNTYTVEYERLHVFDDENIEGYSLNRKILYYRVLDWFDCQGLCNMQQIKIQTHEKFVNNITFFRSLRIDGRQKYLDLVCESFLTENQLKSFDYGDTMARLKTTSLLEERGFKKAKLSLWKRDIYPVYK